MKTIPVLLRELRSETRRPFTYWLRVLGAAMAMAAAFLMSTDLTAASPAAGAGIFAAVNTAIFVAIWTLVPLLTADCLSRERREGTLGLLLLTPLTPVTVVVAKSLVQMLRAWSLILAVLPVFALAFLLGGVGWFAVLNATCLNLASVSLALSAGLLISSRAKSWHRAAVAAVIVSWFIAMSFAQVYTMGIAVQVLLPLGFLDAMPHWQEWIRAGMPLLTGFGGAWTNWAAFLPPTSLPLYLGVSFQFLILAQLVLWGAIRFAALQITRAKAERPWPRPWLYLRNLFFQPLFFRDLLRERQMLRLHGNPIGWLQGRTTIARLVKWGWCLALVLVEAVSMATLPSHEFARLQPILTFALAVGICLSSGSSFREERDSGALELILVSPLTETQIIRGRLRGLYAQFLPAAGVLGFFLLFPFILSGSMPLQPARYDGQLLRSGLLVLSSAWACLPPIGLLYSVRCPNLGVAWGQTVAVGLLFPWLIALVLGFVLETHYASNDVIAIFPAMGNPSVSSTMAPRIIVAIQAALALFAYRRLHRCLRERQFSSLPLNRAGLG